MVQKRDEPYPNEQFARKSRPIKCDQALLFTIAVEITTVLHAFGHILSGKMVRSAMDELLITATRDVNLYHGDQSLIPGHIHLVRSLGGPIFNIFIAGLCSALAVGIAPGFWSELVASLISTNQFFGFGSLLPLPSVDGEVIWRELLRPIHERLKMKDVSPESKKKSPRPQVSQDKE